MRVGSVNDSKNVRKQFYVCTEWDHKYSHLCCFLCCLPLKDNNRWTLAIWYLCFIDFLMDFTRVSGQQDESCRSLLSLLLPEQSADSFSWTVVPSTAWFWSGTELSYWDSWPLSVEQWISVNSKLSVVLPLSDGVALGFSPFSNEWSFVIPDFAEVSGDQQVVCEITHKSVRRKVFYNSWNEVSGKKEGV